MYVLHFNALSTARAVCFFNSDGVKIILFQRSACTSAHLFFFILAFSFVVYFVLQKTMLRCIYKCYRLHTIPKFSSTFFLSFFILLHQYQTTLASSVHMSRTQQYLSKIKIILIRQLVA